MRFLSQMNFVLSSDIDDAYWNGGCTLYVHAMVFSSFRWSRNFELHFTLDVETFEFGCNAVRVPAIGSYIYNTLANVLVHFLNTFLHSFLATRIRLNIKMFDWNEYKEECRFLCDRETIIIHAMHLSLTLF